MKILKKMSIFLIFCFIVPLFSGCTSGSSSLMITAYPNKMVYQVGEKFDYSGLKMESYNTDGTNCNTFVSPDEIGEVDTSTAGEKKVKITKGDLSTTFSIYVASKVVEKASDLKQAIAESVDGDIIYIKKGVYKPSDTTDESLYNIVIDKKLTIIGDGNKSTILHGNFLVGAKNINGDYIALDNFEDVKFINLGFQLESTQKDKYLTFEGPYENYDLFGAIKTFNSKNVFISGCSFNGYAYGINSDNIENLTLIKSEFRNIKINAVKVTNDIKSSTIAKNIFMDIGSNSLVLDGTKQGNVGALYLSFNKKGNAGVIVASNTFVRIGLKTGGLIYANRGADELDAMENVSLISGSYINNSAIVFLVSSSENNLEVGGIILSANNFGQTMENIVFGTNKDNIINHAGVYINEM